MAVTMNSTVFRDVTPYSLVEVYQRFTASIFRVKEWAEQAECSLLVLGAFFFLIGIVGGGVPIGPLGTAATNRPIVPAPGDYDGEIGGMIGRGNRSTQPHAARTRTWAAAVGSQRLTA
jgi:hypothetical protein